MHRYLAVNSVGLKKYSSTERWNKESTGTELVASFPRAVDPGGWKIKT